MPMQIKYYSFVDIEHPSIYTRFESPSVPKAYMISILLLNLTMKGLGPFDVTNMLMSMVHPTKRYSSVVESKKEFVKNVGPSD